MLQTHGHPIHTQECPSAETCWQALTLVPGIDCVFEEKQGEDRPERPSNRAYFQISVREDGRLKSRIMDNTPKIRMLSYRRRTWGGHEDSWPPSLSLSLPRSLVCSMLRWPETNLCQCQHGAFPKQIHYSNTGLPLTRGGGGTRVGPQGSKHSHVSREDFTHNVRYGDKVKCHVITNSSTLLLSEVKR